jgi:hypothetical protein
MESSRESSRVRFTVIVNYNTELRVKTFFHLFALRIRPRSSPEPARIKIENLLTTVAFPSWSLTDGYSWCIVALLYPMRFHPDSASLVLAFLLFGTNLLRKPFVRNTYTICTILVQISPRKLFRMNTCITLRKQVV